MATRSQTVSTSPNSGEEKKTVLPCSLRRWMISRTFIRPNGSSPLGGSSPRNKPGGLGKAGALWHAFGIGFDQALARRLQIHQLEHGGYAFVPVGARDAKNARVKAQQ